MYVYVCLFSTNRWQLIIDTYLVFLDLTIMIVNIWDISETLKGKEKGSNRNEYRRKNDDEERKFKSKRCNGIHFFEFRWKLISNSARKAHSSYIWKSRWGAKFNYVTHLSLYGCVRVFFLYYNENMKFAWNEISNHHNHYWHYQYIKEGKKELIHLISWKVFFLF